MGEPSFDHGAAIAARASQYDVALALGATKPTGQPDPMDPARAVIIGSHSFCESWRSALRAVAAPSLHIKRGAADLALLDGEREDVHTTVAKLVGSVPSPVVVVFSSNLTSAMTEWHGRREILVLPRPQCEAVAQIIAHQLLLDLPRRQRDGAPEAQGAAERFDPPARLSAALTADFERRCLVTSGQCEDLSTGELEILRYLTRRQGQWVTTQAISRDVFRRSDPAALNLVWKYLSWLRRKLAKHGCSLESARTKGYRLRVFSGEPGDQP